MTCRRGAPPPGAEPPAKASSATQSNAARWGGDSDLRPRRRVGGRRGVSREVGTALLAEAAAMGIDARPVATAADEAQVDLLIAIGMPVAYPDLIRRPATATRLHWFADPLPAAPRESFESGCIGPCRRAGCSIDRCASFPAWRGSARVRAARETAEREREQHKNEHLIRATMAHFDHLVLDTTDRAERAARLGIAARAVPVRLPPHVRRTARRARDPVATSTCCSSAVSPGRSLGADGSSTRWQVSSPRPGSR